MYRHHEESIEKLKEYFLKNEKPIAIILDGSIVKGNARADSDVDAVIVVSEKRYEELRKENRLAEVIKGYCTYEGGYFDIKYKTKALLKKAAESASEPTRNAYVKARVIYSEDEEIENIVKKIEAYPENTVNEKIRCFSADLELNYGYFLNCVKEDNAYMRAHLAAEIVYSVYRLILIENRALFPCNRRLEETVISCKKRPGNIIDLAAAFLKDVTKENADNFVNAFKKYTSLPIITDVSECCSAYVEYYEDWWLKQNPPFPDEW